MELQKKNKMFEELQDKLQTSDSSELALKLEQQFQKMTLQEVNLIRLSRKCIGLKKEADEYKESYNQYFSKFSC